MATFFDQQLVLPEAKNVEECGRAFPESNSNKNSFLFFLFTHQFLIYFVRLRSEMLVLEMAPSEISARNSSAVELFFRLTDVLS